MGTLLLIIAVPALFVLLIWLISIFWRRLIDQAFSVHFRAAEAITEHNQLPDEWITEIQRKIDRKMFNLFRIRKKGGVELLLAKLDKTIQFFDNGSFYADDDAKTIVLSELANTRQRIEGMSWDELLLEHNHNRTLDSNVAKPEEG